MVDRKNLDHSIFRAHIKLGTFLTILGFPKSNARQKKITFLNLKWIQKVLMKNIP